MELDTGTTVSVISETDWSRLIRDTLPLEPCTGPWILRISTRSIAGQATVEVTYIYEQQKASLPLLVIAGIKRLQESLAIIKVNWLAWYKIQGDKLQSILAKHSALF